MQSAAIMLVAMTVAATEVSLEMDTLAVCKLIFCEC